MPAIVMTEPLHAKLGASSVYCFLVLPDREDISSSLALPAPRITGIGLEIVKQPLHRRYYRDPSAVVALCAGILVSRDPDLFPRPVDVRPLHPTRFIDATAGEC
jgi:hypothetical protein